MDSRPIHGGFNNCRIERRGRPATRSEERDVDGGIVSHKTISQEGWYLESGK